MCESCKQVSRNSVSLVFGKVSSVLVAAGQGRRGLVLEASGGTPKARKVACWSAGQLQPRKSQANATSDIMA